MDTLSIDYLHRLSMETLSLSLYIMRERGRESLCRESLRGSLSGESIEAIRRAREREREREREGEPFEREALHREST